MKNQHPNKFYLISGRCWQDKQWWGKHKITPKNEKKYGKLLNSVLVGNILESQIWLQFRESTGTKDELKIHIET